MKAVIKDVGVIKQKQINSFWSNVDKTSNPNGCWEWQGCLINNGYGVRSINRTTFLVHRLSWLLTYGKQTEKFLLHSCDNRICVNPSHLREGDHLDNARDKTSRDRQAKGETHGRRKLQTKDIPEIERLYYVAKLTDVEIAKRFEVTRSTISNIVHGRIWKHVPRLYLGTERPRSPQTRPGKYSYKGVYFHKCQQKFNVRISANNKRFDLGYYDSAEEAARAYDAKAKELFGEFAYLNFPEPRNNILLSKTEAAL